MDSNSSNDYDLMLEYYSIRKSNKRATFLPISKMFEMNVIQWNQIFSVIISEILEIKHG